jgi:hypothetical protein
VSLAIWIIEHSQMVGGVLLGSGLLVLMHVTFLGRLLSQVIPLPPRKRRDPGVQVTDLEFIADDGTRYRTEYYPAQRGTSARIKVFAPSPLDGQYAVYDYANLSLQAGSDLPDLAIVAGEIASYIRSNPQ